jgi:hypothetical protein
LNIYNIISFLILLIISLDSDDETRNVSDGERVRAPGYQMGLTALVDPHPEDYYYPLLSSYGAKVTTVRSLAMVLPYWSQLNDAFYKFQPK